MESAIAVPLDETCATGGRIESAALAEQRQRVLVIARDFPPSRLIGAQACAQISRYLPLYGWDPIVLSVDARYLESPDPNARIVFPGTIVRTGVLPHPIGIYRKLKRIRRPTAAGHGGTEESNQQPSRIRRWVLSVLQVPDIYTGWIAPAVIAGLIAIRKWRITHIFSSAPFWTNHLVGLVLADLTGLPWTVHLRDPWTQVSRSNLVSTLSTKLDKWLEGLVMSRANVVVCVTERHTRLLRQMFPNLPAEKFVTIPNGYDEAEWNGSAESLQSAESDRRRFVITFGGSLYGTLSPRPLFRALRRLIDSGDVSRDEVLVDLFGSCDMAEGVRVLDMAAESKLAECVRVGSPLSRSETFSRMVASDLLLVLAGGLDLQIPGKTYEYLRAARPILALTSDGALADLLRQTGGAWVVEPADEAAIADAVREAFLAWKRGSTGPTADPAVVATFERRLLAGRFAALFENTTAARAANTHASAQRKGNACESMR